MMVAIAGHLGWRVDQEDFAGTLRRGMPKYAAWRASWDPYKFELPKEIDPRSWWETEDQGNMNSCEGNSLADSLEYLNVIATGEKVQLSRVFAYLASQELFGRNGGLGQDGGATLDPGGTKAAARGIPLESDFPYDTNYGSVYRKYKSELQTILAGKLWKAKTAVPLRTFEDVYMWLATWTGCVHIGIAWSLSDAGETILDYREAGGGHAIIFGGYKFVDAWSKTEPGIWMKNSHGPGWGVNGWSLCHPRAVKKILAGSWHQIIGRSDMVAPNAMKRRGWRQKTDGRIEIAA